LEILKYKLIRKESYQSGTIWYVSRMGYTILDDIAFYTSKRIIHELNQEILEQLKINLSEDLITTEKTKK
jgi:hypothetical protein